MRVGSPAKGALGWILAVIGLAACAMGTDESRELEGEPVGTVQQAVGVGGTCLSTAQCNTGLVCCSNPGGLGKKCAACCFYPSQTNCGDYYECAEPCDANWYSAKCCPDRLGTQWSCASSGQCFDTYAACNGECISE